MDNKYYQELLDILNIETEKYFNKVNIPHEQSIKIVYGVLINFLANLVFIATDIPENIIPEIIASDVITVLNNSLRKNNKWQ